MARNQRTTSTTTGGFDDQTMRARNNRQQRGGQRGTGPTGGRPGGRNTRTGPGGQATGVTGPPSGPGTSGTASQYVEPGTGWWNKANNPYGANVMTNDPSGQAFWSMYGQNQQGWSSADPSQNWFQSTYNPQALGAAINAGAGPGYDPMKGMTDAAGGLLGGGHAVNWNSGKLIGDVMQALATGDLSTIGKVNPALAQIIASGASDPMGMVGALSDFLGEALGGIIPDNALQSLQTMLNYAGNEFFRKKGAAGNNNMNGANFAKFATQLFGPTLGF